MKLPRLTKLELQIMNVLWDRGASSVREVQEAFPGKNRPAYTTVGPSSGAGRVTRLLGIATSDRYRWTFSRTSNFWI